VCFGLYSDDAGTGRECRCVPALDGYMRIASIMMMLTLITVFSIHYVESFIESYVLKVY